jgi:hypothetical protein
MAVFRILIIAACLIGALELRPAQALWGWRQGPWCAYLGHSGITDCAYYTFAQCRATVFGVGGYCAPNPNFVAPAPGPRYYRKRRAY